MPGEINNNGCSSKQSSCRTGAAKGRQPPVGATAVSCRACRPRQPPQLQQQTPAATASIQHSRQGLTDHTPFPALPSRLQRNGGGRAIDLGLGPQHAATASSLQRRQVAAPWARASKRSRSSVSSASSAAWATMTATVAPVPSTSSAALAASAASSSTAAATAWQPPACCSCKACQQWNQNNPQVLWNNDNVLRLFHA